MIAVLSPCVFRCRSRQLYDAFSSPSWNHLKNGAFDSSSTRVNGLCQSTCSFASRPQKPSKSRSASSHSAWKAAAPDTLACLTNSGEGGNSRSSCSTDSMVAEAIGKPPLWFFCGQVLKKRGQSLPLRPVCRNREEQGKRCRAASILTVFVSPR